MNPRKTSSRAAAAVLATTAGAAVATVAFAAPADAATHHTVWDRVAHCESGNRWHIDTGNGFYGGLQFAQHTWHSFHGTKYAHHADHATRKEQIQVARRVLDAQGPDAWPVCSHRADLTMHDGHATGARLPQEASTDSYGGKHRSRNHHRANGEHHGRHHHTHREHYRVRSGDTLTSIAHRFHVHGGWHALYRANTSRLSSPDRLTVGQRLVLP